MPGNAARRRGVTLLCHDAELNKKQSDALLIYGLFFA
jgi:hypothetical protein